MTGGGPKMNRAMYRQIHRAGSLPSVTSTGRRSSLLERRVSYIQPPRLQRTPQWSPHNFVDTMRHYAVATGYFFAEQSSRMRRLSITRASDILHAMDSMRISNLAAFVHQQHSKVLNPEEGIKPKWDCFVLLVCLIFCALLPLDVSFEFSEFAASSSFLLHFIDIVLLLDMLVTFQTARIDPISKKTIIDPFPIAKSYLSSMDFVVDIFSSVPTAFFPSSSWRTLILCCRSVTFLRVNRLRKGGIFTRFEIRLSLIIPTAILRLVKLLFVYWYLHHYIAAVYYKLVIYELAHHDRAHLWEIPFEDHHTIGYRYMCALERAFFVTAGRVKNLRTETTFESMFMSAGVVIGVVANAIVIGTAAGLVEQLTKTGDAELYHRECVTRFLNKSNIDIPTRQSVLSFYDSTLGIDEPHRAEAESALRNLPDRLDLWLQYFLHQDVVSKAHFFELLTPEQTMGLLLKMKTALVSPGDLIVKAGEPIQAFYLIESGEVRINDVKTHTTTILSPGGYFGEDGLIKEEPIVFNAIANTYSKLNMLYKADFNDLTKENEKIKSFLNDAKNKLQTPDSSQKMKLTSQTKSLASLGATSPAQKLARQLSRSFALRHKRINRVAAPPSVQAKGPQSLALPSKSRASAGPSTLMLPKASKASNIPMALVVACRFTGMLALKKKAKSFKDAISHREEDPAKKLRKSCFLWSSATFSVYFYEYVSQLTHFEAQQLARLRPHKTLRSKRHKGGRITLAMEKRPLQGPRVSLLTGNTTSASSKDASDLSNRFPSRLPPLLSEKVNDHGSLKRALASASAMKEIAAVSPKGAKEYKLRRKIAGRLGKIIATMSASKLSPEEPPNPLQKQSSGSKSRMSPRATLLHAASFQGLLRKHRAKGTRNDLADEIISDMGQKACENFDKLALRRAQSFIISLHSPYKMYWDCFVAIWTAYYVLFLPLDLCFAFTNTISSTQWLQVGVDIVFILEIFLLFRTATINPLSHEDITDAPSIARLYFSGYFIFDVLSAIPTAFVEPHLRQSANITDSFNQVKLLRLAVLFRAYRLANAPIFSKLMLWMSCHVHPATLRLGKYVGLYIGLHHYLACFYYMVLVAEQEVMDESIELWRPPFHVNDTMLSKYVGSFFQAATVMGAYTLFPKTTPERIFTGVGLIVAIVSNSCLFGIVADLLVARSKVHDDHHDHIAAIIKNLDSCDVEEDIQTKVLEFYNSAWSFENAHHPDQMFASLPEKLQLHLEYCTHRSLLDQVSFFQHLPPEEMLKLLMAMDDIVVLKDDLIIKAGERPRAFYVIETGMVEVYESSPDGSRVLLSTLRAGSFFGEVSLMNNEPTTANVRAMTYCNLKVLPKAIVDSVLRKHKRLKSFLNSSKSKRMQNSNAVHHDRRKSIRFAAKEVQFELHVTKEWQKRLIPRKLSALLSAMVHRRAAKRLLKRHKMMLMSQIARSRQESKTSVNRQHEEALRRTPSTRSLMLQAYVDHLSYFTAQDVLQKHNLSQGLLET